MSKDKKRRKRRQKKRVRRTMKRQQRAKSRALSSPALGTSGRDAGVPPSDALSDPAAVTSAMMEMESLGAEPEFADLVADLDEDIVRVVVELVNESDEDIQRLEAAGDERGINQLMQDATFRALNKLITPAFQDAVRKRLNRLSRRLRRERQRQRAERIDTLAQMLDSPVFPWPLFRPLTDAFDKTFKAVLGQWMVHTTLAEITGVSPEDMSPDQMVKSLQDPTVVQRLQERYEENEDLRNALEDQFEQLHDRLTHALFEGDLNLGLFTSEELVLWDVLAVQRLSEAGLDWEQEDKSPEGLQVLAETLGETVRLLNTPDRQARWRERLAQLEAESPEAEMQALLSIIENVPTDPDESKVSEDWLHYTYAGEHRQLQKRRAADETLAEQFETIYEQILERLDRGEPPLP